MKIDIPIEVLQSMKKIVDMYIEGEKKHYDECLSDDKSDQIYENMVSGPTFAINMDLTPKYLTCHIYNDLELVNRFIHSQELQADIDLAERDF